MLVCELFDDINQMKMHCEFTEVMVVKIENSTFHRYFLNINVLLNISYELCILSTCIYKT